MSSKSFLFVALFLVPLISSAQQGERGYDRDHGAYQRNESSTLSIFSENGDLFYLVLNNINQNSAPASKIRVEGLPQFGNDVQIMFADNVTPGIRRKINIADPVDGKAVNMTLKIERGRDGVARLKFNKCKELDHNYRPEQGEYVMNYGNPNQIVYPADGYNQNGGQMVTQTTTYTQNQQLYQAPPPPPPPAPVAMDDQSFNDALNVIKGASFDDSRMTSVKTILGPNYVNTDQVRAVCNTFSFEEDRLNVIKLLYKKTIDQNNVYKLADLFSFDSNKDALNKFIMANQK